VRISKGQKEEKGPAKRQGRVKGGEITRQVCCESRKAGGRGRKGLISLLGWLGGNKEGGYGREAHTPSKSCRLGNSSPYLDTQKEKLPLTTKEGMGKSPLVRRMSMRLRETNSAT